MRGWKERNTWWKPSIRWLVKHHGMVARTVPAAAGIVAVGLGVYSISEFLFGPINAELSRLAYDYRLPGSGM